MAWIWASQKEKDLSRLLYRICGSGLILYYWFSWISSVCGNFLIVSNSLNNWNSHSIQNRERFNAQKFPVQSPSGTVWDVSIEPKIKAVILKTIHETLNVQFWLLGSVFDRSRQQNMQNIPFLNKLRNVLPEIQVRKSKSSKTKRKTFAWVFNSY